MFFLEEEEFGIKLVYPFDTCTILTSNLIVKVMVVVKALNNSQ